MRKGKKKPATKRVNVARCYVERYDIDYNTEMYVCRSRGFLAPVGFVWGFAMGADKDAYGDVKLSRFEVLGSFVPDWARRSGIRSLINKTILQTFDVIHTNGATPEGAEFMKSSGYKRDPLGGYFIRKGTT